MRRTRSFSHLLGLILLTLIALPGRARAEDADRFRPYLRFHSGDVSPLWGVDDLWSFGVGANFNQNWGGEVILDFFEREYELSPYGTLGEVSAWNFVPEARLRFPLLQDRLVPYVIAGIGPSFLQFNDRKKSGYGLDIDIEDMSFAVAAGAGVEYFIADNVTFGLEGKYMWVNPIDGTVEGQTVDVDVSSAIFTFGLRVYFDENQPQPLATEDERDPNRFYFGVRVGGSVRTDDEWTSGVSIVPEPSALGGTVNQTGSLVLGADFGENWGIELTADSLEHGIRIEDYGTIGEYGMGVVIPQLRLRYPLQRGRWVPYFATGVGIAYGEFNDGKEAGAGLKVDTSGIYPALSVGGGIEYFVVRNFSLSADARWVYTWGHEIDIADVVSGSGDFSMVQFSLGFRVYLFDF